MAAIGEWVIDQACRAAASWPEPITVALNISPKQIGLPNLPNVVSEALARHKLPGNRIELEVTEGVFLGDNGSTLDVLKRLRALGVGIALDDFGTGYSSIGYLNKAVFHKLKIDGSFVREAGSRPENVAIIQSIVQLAKSFRMSITAKGSRPPRISSACATSAATPSRAICSASRCPTSAPTRWSSASAPSGWPAKRPVPRAGSAVASSSADRNSAGGRACW
jgi:predicted signal transduction protein with EAL and GGDEF domain